MNRHLITGVLCLAVSNGIMSAQGRCEVWLDDDSGNVITCVYSSDGCIGFPVDVNALGPGLHLLNILPIGENGVTGSLYRTMFFKPEKTDSYIYSQRQCEVWLDDDGANAVKCSYDASGIMTLPIDVAALSPGLHFLNMLPVGERGISSSVYRTMFYKPEKTDSEIFSCRMCEVWFDDESANTVRCGYDVNGILKLPMDTDGLSPGLHVLNILPVGKDGATGSVYRTMLYIAAAPEHGMAGYEYQIDDRDAIAADTSPEGEMLPLSIDVKGLENGEHTFTFRARNAFGVWGETFVSTFMVDSDRTPVDDADWAALVALVSELSRRGCKNPWDISLGPDAVYSFDGIILRDGRIVEIDLSHLGLGGEFPLTLCGFTALESLDISDNEFEGNLGMASAMSATLVRLDASGNRFDNLMPQLPQNIKDLDISGQRIRKTFNIDFSDIDVMNMLREVPMILLYDHSKRGYATELQMKVTQLDSETYIEPDETDWYMDVKAGPEGVSVTGVSPRNEYHGAPGDMARAFLMRTDGGVDGSTMPLAVHYAMGDANFLGGVDATDLQATILYAFDQYKTLPFNFSAADTYTDDRINVQDVVRTVDILMDRTIAGEAAVPGKRLLTTDGGKDAAGAVLILRDGDIVLKSDIPVAVLAIKGTGDVEWALDGLGMSQKTVSGSVVAYSMGSSVLPAGETVIGHAYGHASLVSASLSDENAAEIPVRLTVESSGIEGMEDTDAGEEAFDILGRKIYGSRKGIGITRRNGRYEKRVIR